MIDATVSERHWYSVTQAADYLGCSRNFLDKDRVTRLHGIPFSRLGRHIRYSRAALDAYLEGTQVETAKVEEECHE